MSEKHARPGAGKIALLHSLVQYDIKRSGATASTLIRAGLLDDILNERDELLAALEPFAAVAADRNLADHPDSYAPRPSRGSPSLADYRRAAAAIARATGAA